MSELVLSANAVAGLGDLRRFLDALHELWRKDPEAAHGIDDDIRERVLELVAAGHDDAALLAREVLVTSAWTDVDRWYA